MKFSRVVFLWMVAVLLIFWSLDVWAGGGICVSFSGAACTPEQLSGADSQESLASALEDLEDFPEDSGLGEEFGEELDQELGEVLDNFGDFDFDEGLGEAMEEVGEDMEEMQGDMEERMEEAGEKTEEEKEERETEEEEQKEEEEKIKKAERGERTRQGAGYKPGSQSVGVNGTASEDSQTFAIPYAIAVTSSIKLGMSLPYTITKEAKGFGNLGVSAKYLIAPSESVAFLTSLGADLPTGDEAVGSRTVVDYNAGENAVLNLGVSRVFGGVSYALKSVDDEDFDQGDTLSLTFGGDFPFPLLGSETNMFAAFLLSFTGEDVSQGEGDGNQNTLLDTAVGLVFRQYNARLGVTVPTFTQSDVIEHSSRKVILNFGVRYNL